MQLVVKTWMQSVHMHSAIGCIDMVASCIQYNGKPMWMRTKTTANGQC